MSGIHSVWSSQASLSQYLAGLTSAASNPSLTPGATSSASSTSDIAETPLASLFGLLEDGAAAAGANSSSGASAGADSTTDASTDADSTTDASDADAPSGGASGLSLSDLRTQIESAVNGALSNLSGSALSNPGVAAKAVRAAVDQTLKQDGYLSGGATTSSTTPTTFGAAADGAATGSSAAGSVAGSGASSAATTNTAIFSAFSLSAATAQSSLLDSLLSQNNVDPGDFQNSLLSALSNVSSGAGVDFSQLFANFPGGQDINAIV